MVTSLLSPSYVLYRLKFLQNVVEPTCRKGRETWESLITSKRGMFRFFFSFFLFSSLLKEILLSFRRRRREIICCIPRSERRRRR